MTKNNKCYASAIHQMNNSQKIILNLQLLFCSLCCWLLPVSRKCTIHVFSMRHQPVDCCGYCWCLLGMYDRWHNLCQQCCWCCYKLCIWFHMFGLGLFIRWNRWAMLAVKLVNIAHVNISKQAYHNFSLPIQVVQLASTSPRLVPQYAQIATAVHITQQHCSRTPRCLR